MVWGRCLPPRRRRSRARPSRPRRWGRALFFRATVGALCAPLAAHRSRARALTLTLVDTDTLVRPEGGLLPCGPLEPRRRGTHQRWRATARTRPPSGARRRAPRGEPAALMRPWLRLSVSERADRVQPTRGVALRALFSGDDAAAARGPGIRGGGGRQDAHGPLDRQRALRLMSQAGPGVEVRARRWVGPG